MADASVRVRKLAGIAALARTHVPAATAAAAPIQRRRIHEGPTSFLSGTAPDEARIRDYVDRYEIADMAQSLVPHRHERLTGVRSCPWTWSI